MQYAARVKSARGKNARLKNLALVIGAISLPAQAETVTNLDTLVIEADALNADPGGTMKSAAPADSQSLTLGNVGKEKIESLQVNDISEAIDTISGIHRIGGGTNYDYVSRGFSLTRDNVKMDGMNAWALKDQSMPAILLDDVEVLKGVGSMFYGSQEPGGTINLVTKKPQAERYNEIDLQGGAWLSDDTDAGWGKSALSFDSTGEMGDRKDVLYRVIGEYRDDKGFRDDEDKDGYFLAPMLTWLIDDRQSLTAQFEVTRYDYNYPSGLVAADSDIKQVADITTNYLGPQNDATDEGVSASLTYNRDLGNGWSNVTKWRSVWHEDERANFWVRSVRDGTVKRSYRHLLNKQENHSLDSYFTGEVMTGSIAHRLTLGGSYAYTRNDFNRLNWGNIDSALDLDLYNPVHDYIDLDSISNGDGLHRVFTYDTYSLYGQDVIALTDKLDLQAGLRYDWQHREMEAKAYTNVSGRSYEAELYETNEDFLTPTLGLSYRLNNDWRLHGSYSESYETSAVSNTDADGNTFDPETGKQYEVGIHYTPAADWNAELVLFQINKENVIVSGDDGYSAALGEVRSRGAELGLGWNPTSRLALQASYTLLDTVILTGDQDTADNEEGNEFLNSPHNQLSLQAQYKASEALDLGAVFFAQSRRYGSSDNELELPGFGRLDLTASYQLSPNMDMGLALKNVFDKQYYLAADRDTAVYPGAPRFLQASLKYRF
ncbi:TonB-dependent siderophore receptor [Marinobacterium mangrovicola]|uniref:TonB-dependent siderophore receptor n=1 Tax=Marinobacterium mangrovicola TaxID=1476959 RepID=A0A4R1G978_9GAMM|nr:TonB-dependent siderophore receptor [Marinobacterium mangrovicola]